jgi:site-specific DNA-methyltransferase (adenine-specific)/modification methylase
MKLLPDGSVDVVITSPPYNMRTRIRNGKYVEREIAEHFSKKYTDFHDALPPESYYGFHVQCVREFLRISPTSIINIQVVTGSKVAWFRIIGEFREYLKDIAVWDKGFGEPAMHEGVINRASELILLFDSTGTAGREFTKRHFNRGEMPDIWRFSSRGGNVHDSHAATFPVEVPAMAVTGWTGVGETVIDPFLGLGTTAVAAKKLGRHFLGFEISEEYCRIARERIAMVEAQPNLFDKKPEQIKLY